MASFKDYLDYYKQTGKLPSGVDKNTMESALQNAEVLGLSSDTQQTPFNTAESYTPSLSNVKLAGDDANFQTVENNIIPNDNKIESASQKALKLANNKQDTSTPVVSPETQKIGIGERPEPIDQLKDEEMEAAQDQVRQNQAKELYASAGRQIAEGLGGLGSGQQINLSKDLESTLGKTTNLPVEQLAQAREQQVKRMQVAEEAAKNDPNSPVSKVMRDSLKELGVKVPYNATYATMEKLTPQIMKNKEFQMRMQEMALKREELAADKGVKQANKNEEKEHKGLVAVGTYRGEPDVSKLKQRLEQVSSVIANIGDVNKPWSEVEKQAVQQEINAFLKGGSPTDQDARHTYKSLEGEASQLMSKVTNDPQAFNDPATKQRILNFVKPVYEHHKDYLDRRDARKLIAEGYNKWSDTSKNEAAYMYPDAVNMIESKKVISPYGTGHATKGTVDAATLMDYASKHNINVDKAKELLSKAGYNVE